MGSGPRCSPRLDIAAIVTPIVGTVLASVGVLYRDIKKDRRGRPLGYGDIGRYQGICAALAETPRLMARIDGAIAARGGWPIG